MVVVVSSRASSGVEESTFSSTWKLFKKFVGDSSRKKDVVRLSTSTWKYAMNLPMY